MIRGEGLDDLDEGLAQVGRITSMIRDLQATLELFERGRKGEALEKISHLEEEVQDLEGSVLADEEEAKEKLALVLEHLEWVEENEDRASGSS
jgi:hypothetical protein